MSTTQKQRGFGIIEVLVIIAVVGLLGVIGFIAYQRLASPTKTESAMSSSHSSSPATESTVTKPLIRQKVLKIKEWNVKVSYNEADTYSYIMSDDKRTATIISKQLASQDAGCSTFGAGQVLRFAPTDRIQPGDDTTPTAKEDAKAHLDEYRVVDGNYYRFVHSQSQCGSVSVDEQKAANARVKALVIKKLTDDD